MKKIAICLDYDGCLTSMSYVYPFTPENVKDIKTNTSIIDINCQLWDAILEICIANPDLELLTLVHFSARQSADTDANNSFSNDTESYFLAMTKILSHVTHLLKSKGINIKIELNCLLMPDIYHNREHGHTLKKAAEDIDYSLEGRGMIKRKQHHDDYLADESKVSFVFAHVHAIDAQAFYYLDDRSDIHNTILKFYGHPVGQSFIPYGVKIVSCHYYDNVLLNPCLSEIIGIGKKCDQYADILRSIYKKLGSCSNIFPSTRDQNIEESIRQFNKLYQEHVYEDFLKLSPLQYDLSNASSMVHNNYDHKFDSAPQQQAQATSLQNSLLSGFLFFEAKNSLDNKSNDEINSNERRDIFIHN